MYLATRSRRSALFLVAVSRNRSSSRILSLSSAWRSLILVGLLLDGRLLLPEQPWSPCDGPRPRRGPSWRFATARRAARGPSVICARSRLFCSPPASESGSRGPWSPAARWPGPPRGSSWPAPTSACASARLFLTLLTSSAFFAVSVFQFFEVTKTIVEMARNISEKAMMTSTRILPTWVMVPSYHSE